MNARYEDLLSGLEAIIVKLAEEFSIGPRRYPFENYLSSALPRRKTKISNITGSII
jgi:hypothetical protein